MVANYRRVPVDVVELRNSSDDEIIKATMRLSYLGIPLAIVGVYLGITSRHIRQLMLDRGVNDPVDIYVTGRRDEAMRYLAKYDMETTAKLCGVSVKTLERWLKK